MNSAHVCLQFGLVNIKKMAFQMPLALLFFKLCFVQGNLSLSTSSAMGKTAVIPAHYTLLLLYLYTGIAVSGGSQFESAVRSVEVYVPSTGLSCFLPPLPDNRYAHTMDGLYICGGDLADTNCLHLVNGNVMVATM